MCQTVVVDEGGVECQTPRELLKALPGLVLVKHNSCNNINMDECLCQVDLESTFARANLAWEHDGGWIRVASPYIADFGSISFPKSQKKIPMPPVKTPKEESPFRRLNAAQTRLNKAALAFARAETDENTRRWEWHLAIRELVDAAEDYEKVEIEVIVSKNAK